MVEGLVLYKEITKIAEDYFGPAAPRFINRMVASHLEKDPDQLTCKDLPELIDWIKLAASIFTEETAAVNEFTARLHTLETLP